MMKHTADALMASAIRTLAMDAVEQAKSGHPGMPMGMAEIGVALWTRHYRHSPRNPRWIDRDRFVVSNGHGSMLQYALLHLTGYDLPMGELANFRQLHSKTPGHPESFVTPGIETTTGPLGQGLANAVGMALAESLLAREFNRPGHAIVDHHTYVFMGDGCLMEGISHEACSLAGTLELGKLIALWDDNGISIDGRVQGWFTDDTPARFDAYGWHVVREVDGHDVDAVDRAIQAAKADPRPSLICCRTVIGKGAPNLQGSDKVHGAALGATEIMAARAAMEWAHAPFEVPDEIYAHADARDAGTAREVEWSSRFTAYAKSHPEPAAELMRRVQGYLPANWAVTVARTLADCESKRETIASRKASLNTIEAYAAALPELLGGSADLTGSNLTQWKAAKPVRAGQLGQHINYGVREFAMCAMMNGIVLHGGHRPFGGTFLTFSDYARNAIRMAALMKVPSIFVFTHDSIGLGEDGPTHQSIEHVQSLRLIPYLDLWRPADTTETAIAWACAIERRAAGRNAGPTALALSRQNLPFLDKPADALRDIRRGAYVLADVAKPKVVIIGTGSEVSIAVAAQKLLAAEGVAARVVSMPSNTVFDRQSIDYKRTVLPDGIPRIAIEAGVTDGWWKYGCAAVLGIDTYGESAPADVLYQHFGLTEQNLARTVRDVLRVRP
ncbi:transketolase [soil metagenome]